MLVAVKELLYCVHVEDITPELDAKATLLILKEKVCPAAFGPPPYFKDIE